jgi:uroporphyrinogen decarboxylase
MRQAGRYQRAYQAFRRRHSFETLCRDPELAAKVALSAVADFDFDAAILFSDLLFPLQALGFGLAYDDSGPHLNRRLTPAFLARLRSAAEAAPDLAFQAEAVAATRRELPVDRGLIGFIGGPWTLFVYAIEGSHSGSLARAKSSPDLYRRFARLVVPLLQRMTRAQLDAGADLVMVFDTAAGELTPTAFRAQLLPDLARLADAFPGKVGYYARNLGLVHLCGRASMPAGRWAGLGVDWRWDLASALTSATRRGFLQGNFDPALLHLTGAALGRALDEFLGPVTALTPDERRGWICGLGHGVLPGTPEASMRTFVRTVRRRLA